MILKWEILILIISQLVLKKFYSIKKYFFTFWKLSFMFCCGEDISKLLYFFLVRRISNKKNMMLSNRKYISTFFFCSVFIYICQFILWHSLLQELQSLNI